MHLVGISYQTEEAEETKTFQVSISGPSHPSRMPRMYEESRSFGLCSRGCVSQSGNPRLPRHLATRIRLIDVV